MPRTDCKRLVALRKFKVARPNASTSAEVHRTGQCQARTVFQLQMLARGMGQRKLCACKHLWCIIRRELANTTRACCIQCSANQIP